MAYARLMRRAETGKKAEQLAAQLLERAGYVILARNWRRPEGELDLVAKTGGVCVFVEVRSRTGLDAGHPLETVDHRKRQRVIRAARLYLDEERPPFSFFQFDCVGVVFSDAGETVEVTHIPDAFRVDDAT